MAASRSGESSPVNSLATPTREKTCSCGQKSGSHHKILVYGYNFFPPSCFNDETPVEEVDCVSTNEYRVIILNGDDETLLVKRYRQKESRESIMDFMKNDLFPLPWSDAKLKILARRLPSEAECDKLLGDFFCGAEMYIMKAETVRPARAATVDAAFRQRAGFLSYVEDLKVSVWNQYRLDFFIWPHKSSFGNKETLSTQAAIEARIRNQPLPNDRMNHQVITYFSAQSGSSSPLRVIESDSRKHVLGLMLLESVDNMGLVSFRNCSWSDVSPRKRSLPEGSEEKNSAKSQHCEEIMDKFILSHLKNEDLKETDVTIVLSKAPCRRVGQEPKDPDEQSSVRKCYEFFQKDKPKSWTKLFRSVTLVISDDTGPRPFPFDNESIFPGSLKSETLSKINNCPGSQSERINAASYRDLDSKARSKIDTIVERTQHEINHHHLQHSPEKRDLNRSKILIPAKRKLSFSKSNETEDSTSQAQPPNENDAG